MSIDKTAIISKTAQIGNNVRIGAYSIIKDGVYIGDNTVVDEHVIIEKGTKIGNDCHFFPFCSIGTVPQDLKFQGEDTSLVIGDRNTFREFITVNRATAKGGGVTLIGSDNLFMAYVHIAHDCQVGNRVIMANAATLGGHIHIGDNAVIGGLSGIHQFVRVGAYSIIGGCSAVSQDVPPYTSAVGNRARLHGLNLTGLKRHGFSAEVIADLKRAYKILFRREHRTQDAIKLVEETLTGSEVGLMLDFVKTADTNRGICHG